MVLPLSAQSRDGMDTSERQTPLAPSEAIMVSLAFAPSSSLLSLTRNSNSIATGQRHNRTLGRGKGAYKAGVDTSTRSLQYPQTMLELRSCVAAVFLYIDWQTSRTMSKVYKSLDLTSNDSRYRCLTMTAYHIQKYSRDKSKGFQLCESDRCIHMLRPRYESTCAIRRMDV